ncbi:MAG TPA: TlpA disulfide reductase family protein [Candidatus Acidoferrales bacterium]|jgi:cytochrome c biogenesis protein CcmG/thiol:disulfide interchange protein DsbE|nr:TlpA disulfide reductase family protein [Candidatus Acidoferrales bacterium]
MRKNLFIVVAIFVVVTAGVTLEYRWLKGHKQGVKAAVTKTATDAATAPEVALKDLQGGDVTLAQYEGKVVIVNFWATWCEPCRIEIPWLIEFQQKYGPRGFTVLGVAMDDEGKKAVEPFVQKERFDVNGQQAAMNYPILLGNDAIADKFGGLIGLPTSILISRDGKRVKTIIGLVDHDKITKEIEALL